MIEVRPLALPCSHTLDSAAAAGLGRTTLHTSSRWLAADNVTVEIYCCRHQSILRERRQQNDAHVTHTFCIDLRPCPSPVTLTFNLQRLMVMSLYTCKKSTSEFSWFKTQTRNKRTDRQRDGHNRSHYYFIFPANCVYKTTWCTIT